MNVILNHASTVEFAKTNIKITRAIALHIQAGEGKTVMKILVLVNGTTVVARMQFERIFVISF